MFGKAQTTSLAVGEGITLYVPAPEYPYTGYGDVALWSNDQAPNMVFAEKPNELYARVGINRAFSGVQYITCKYHWTKVSKRGGVVAGPILTKTWAFRCTATGNIIMHLIPETIELNVGETRTLMAWFTATSNWDTMEWKISNPSVASITYTGDPLTTLITAKEPGQALISVNTTLITGASDCATCMLTVKNILPQSVSISGNNIVKKGGTTKLSYSLYPSNAKANIAWWTDDEFIATVSEEGVVSGLKTGTTTVHIITDNMIESTHEITVEKGDLTLNTDKASGLYAKGTNVSLTANFSDADIYYTLDGSTPTENSTRYTGLIAINENLTLKAIAMGSEYNPSSLVTRTYQVTSLKATLFSPSKNTTTSNAYITPSITFNEEIKTSIAFDKLSVSSESSNIAGKFVVDGTVLTFIPEKGELANGTYTINLPQGAVANANGQPNFEDTYKFTVQSEKLTLAASASAGVIIKGTGVAITANFNDAEIYYTLDGKTPTRESSRYTTPIIITDNTKLKAIAVGAKYRNSNVLSVDYVVTDLASTDCTPINGSRLTDMYSKLSISFNDQIKAGIGFRDITLKNGTTEVPGRFAIKENILFFEPSIGKYENGTYTLTLPDYAVLSQKNEPNTAFTNKFTIERNTATIKSDKQSSVVEAGTKVTLTATPSDAKIYYTIDGRKPSVNSTLYTDPVVIDHNTTLKAIAVGENYQQSEVFEGVYRMKNTLSTEAIMPENNAIVASKHTIPTIRFNEPVWKGSGFEGVSLKDANNTKISGEAIVQDNLLYFIPASRSIPGTYTLELPSNAVSDKVANTNAKIISTFTVGDENDRIESVYMNYNSTYYIKKDGSLWSCGRNDYGQLGDGTKTDRSIPIKIMDDVKEIVFAEQNYFVIKKDGSLWGWGKNFKGSIGNGSTNNVLSPVKILNDVIKVAGQYDLTMALTKDGRLWRWGVGYKWENMVYYWYLSTDSYDLSPQLVESGVKDYAFKGNTIFIIKNDNSLWSWGYNTNGFLGDGTKDTHRIAFSKIMDNVREVRVNSNTKVAYAIKTDNSLWAWGENYYLSTWPRGQIGDGTKTNRYSPVKIMSDVRFIDPGTFCYAIKKDGTLWTWGLDREDKNGFGVITSSYSPQKVTDDVEAISRGPLNELVILKNDHTLWSWYRERSSKHADNINAMAANTNHDILSITNDGSLLAYGNNSYGELCNGTTKTTFKKGMEVVFKAAPIAPSISGIELATNKLTVTTGHKAYVALSIQPADADYLSISFSSSNPQVATVSGTGIVTGVKEGTATISVNVDGKFKKTCEVTITDNLDINIIPTQYGKLEPKEPSAKKGENVELAIIPDEEFELDSVCILDGYSSLVNYTIKENTITFTMPSSDVRITSAFKPVKYSLTVSESKHGTVTPSVQKAAFSEIVTLDVSPSENFVLDKCDITDKKGETVEFRAYGHTVEFSMPGSDVTITPTFRENVHIVKIEKADNGEVVILPEKGAEGETISILLNPNKNYYFEGVNAVDSDGKDVATNLLDNIATFLMPHSDVAVNAAFMPLGDMNKDGVIDVADMVLTINHVLGKTVQDDGMAGKMDMNGDGQVDVGDVILIVKAILAQGGLVEMPAEARGKAETVDLTKYTAMQLNVTVPMGTEVADMRIAGSNSDTHQLMYLQTGDDCYTVVVYSLDNQTFGNVEGSLLEVTLDSDGEAVISNVLLATPAGERTFVGSMPMGTATGIRTVGGDVVNGNAVYDLRGNKMRGKGRLPKGVYIMNGKKVIK